MTTNTPPQSIRQNILRKYVRNLIWIDDQLELSDKDASTRIFRPVADCLAHNGILCHLQKYNPKEGDEDPYAEDNIDLKQVAKLASSADIVMLDWHLTSDQSPESAIKLIKKIISDDGLKFIVILSKDSNVSNAFSKEFKDTFKQERTDGFSSKNGKYVFIMTKPDPSNANLAEFSETLVINIFDALQSAYPDRLHWVAVEIISRVREQMPVVLNNIPNGTDLSFLATYANHSREHLQSIVLNSIIDDMKARASSSSLDSIDEYHLGENPLATLTNEHELISKINDPNIKRNIESSFCSIYGRNPVIRKKDIAKHYKNIRASDELDEKLRQAETFASSFCESVSYNKTGIIPLIPGTVVKLSEAPSDYNENLLYAACISPACDAVRQNKLLFVLGTEDTEASYGTAIRLTRHIVGGHNILFDARQIVSLKITEENGNRVVANSEPIGVLREKFAFRLINRLWSNMTRVGVDSNYAKSVYHPDTEQADED